MQMDILKFKCSFLKAFIKRCITNLCTEIKMIEEIIDCSPYSPLSSLAYTLRKFLNLKMSKILTTGSFIIFIQI